MYLSNNKICIYAYIHIYVYSRLLGLSPGSIGEKSRWVKSEQRLPGTFQRKAQESKAGYFGWSRSFGKLGVDRPRSIPLKPFSQSRAEGDGLTHVRNTDELKHY